ncbi:hypothetical protein [Pantoea coffeiphila]|uniref:hypothetical protein n=1 Tax=Pantoea coffeiphila TaxID=1465635 RepID=UPI0011B06275|nr:hypothetical protein [Pantoea coffeiphila]
MFQPGDYSRATLASDSTFLFSKDLNIATQQINQFMNSNALRFAGNIGGFGKNSFIVTCRTNPVGSELFNDVIYYARNISPPPVDPGPSSCSIEVGRYALFHEVEIGKKAKIGVPGSIKCDNYSNVKMILSNGKDNESDGLDIYDTKIKFYLTNGKTSNNYPVPGGTTKNFTITLYLYETGNQPIFRSAYLLIRSEYN